MWSRRFLITGLASGAMLAALALAAIWFVLDVAAGMIASVARFATAGIAVYPLCWWGLVFRKRNYSKSQTGLLVILTFGATCVVVSFVALTVAISSMINEWTVATTAGRKFNPLMSGMPFLAIAVTIIGAIILVIPYALVATPIAFAHRSVMLRLFAGTPPQTTETSL